jgi:hypothetical protein
MLNFNFQEQILLQKYTEAKNVILQGGFGWEIDWQSKINLDNVSEKDFLRESAWVVLSSGMRETVIRKHFSEITFCFLEWESGQQIAAMKKYCIEAALKIFNSPGKINAIAEIATTIANTGFEQFKLRLEENPIETIQALPFMGPVTSYHLAKNIGLPYAKTDRHLFRLSKIFGFPNAQELCQSISTLSGDAIQTVDVVLWRYAVLNKNYMVDLALS